MTAAHNKKGDPAMTTSRETRDYQANVVDSAGGALRLLECRLVFSDRIPPCRDSIPGSKKP